jgi:hypothetical protein
LFKKIHTFLLVGFLICFSQLAFASAIGRPSCFVIAEISEVFTGEQKLDSQKNSTKDYFNVRVVSGSKRNNCPVKEGQTFKVVINHSGVFKKNDRIKAGVVEASSMLPSGVMSRYLHWSNLVYEDGSKIYAKGNFVVVDYFQSNIEPVTYK